MQLSLRDLCDAELAPLDPKNAEYAVDAVDRILALAERLGASDIHFQPSAAGLDLKLRVDGVLQTSGRFPGPVSANLVARLKVLAQLLTYRTDVPQEGRIRAGGDVEMRVSTFPTLFGERAVVRLFAGVRQYQRIDDLGLPEECWRHAAAAARRNLGRDPRHRSGG